MGTVNLHEEQERERGMEQVEGGKKLRSSYREQATGGLRLEAQNRAGREFSKSMIARDIASL